MTWNAEKIIQDLTNASNESERDAYRFGPMAVTKFAYSIATQMVKIVVELEMQRRDIKSLKIELAKEH